MKRPWMWKQAVKQRHPIVSSNWKAGKIIQPGIQSHDTSHCRKSTKAWHWDSFKLKPCREFIPWVLPPHPFQPGIQPGIRPTTDSLPRHGGGTYSNSNPAWNLSDGLFLLLRIKSKLGKPYMEKKGEDTLSQPIY